MIKNIKISGVFLWNLIFIGGCFSTPRIYKYAKAPFSLNEYLKFAETKLDTSSYYFNEWVGFQGEHGNVNIVDVMKFYSDGRFEFRTFKGKAYTKEKGDSLYDFIHYYKIKKGILKLEVYGDRLAGFAYWEGNIYADSIVFFKFKGHKEHIVYKKMK